MTIAWSVAPAVLSVVASFTVGRRPARGSGRVQALTIAATAVGLAAATMVALALLGWFAVARLGPVAERGHWSPALLQADAPVPAPLSLLALILLTAAVANAARRIRTNVLQLRQAHQLLPPETGRLLVLPATEVAAFSLAGLPRNPARIVITRGLLDALPAAIDRDAVIEHEQAHLRCHHYAIRVGVAIATAANPLLAPLRQRTDLALERWADDVAAQKTNAPAIATAIATVAQAAQPPGMSRPKRPVAAALFMAGGPVLLRVDQLLHPQPGAHRQATLWAALLLGAATTTVAVTWHGTEGFFETLITVGAHSTAAR